MAEPLLRRTFSRLRGRERPRGKKAEGGERAPPPASPTAAPEPPREPPRTPFARGAREEPGARREAEEEEEEEEEGDGDAEDAPPSEEAAGGPGKSAGAYLQSLEPSSRRWVLAGDEAAAGEIWYNPIPEDEDEPPRRRGDAAVQDGTHEPPRVPAGGRAEEPGGGGSPVCGKVPLPCVGPGPPSPPCSPGASKKSRSLGKAKSPGTVRRLSLKMKKLPELRRKLSLRSPRPRGPEAEGSGLASPAGKESSNVISRYHLDSSVASPPRAKAAAKGGYLSDGDSPERRAEPEEEEGGLDAGAFQPYGGEEEEEEAARRGGQPVSGLLSVHLRGARDLPAGAREVFCVLQVDGAKRGRTAPLPCTAPFLTLNHTFNLELEGAQHLRVLLFSWDPAAGRNRLCCHGTVGLPHVFAGAQAQRLAVRLRPGGVLFCKVTLAERRPGGEREPRVFGVELRRLVEREQAATKVPLLMQKCLAEIEKRGLKVVGLYRLCGSAAVKKELRDAFERDSGAVMLSERLYPDINVVTGILKDYLRELPTPLITPTLYRVVLEAMGARAPGVLPGRRDAVALLDCLPDAEKATLTRLLDHLSLVASFHAFNRMNPQNIAVCFGPVLLGRGHEPASPRAQHPAGAVDFKRHLEVLHYLLRAWPAPQQDPAPQPGCPCPHRGSAAPERPVVARHRPRGPESPPSNRYAGDWSICGQEVLPTAAAAAATVFVADLEDEPPFGPRLNLKDFDALILDLERELAKPINVCL
ncbi:rho GTPase-activating protein SYDE1 [Dromaius novaehollandiae]|uniref:rho GTPase-activating protein SYDE1 n=1 Tax=Dromaius novaehollandiae TaxID=8790 RepID=UPI00311E7B51